MEGARGHHHHGHVHEAGNGERHQHLPVGEAHQGAGLLNVAGRGAVLGEAGMQEQRVRHHGGADDAHRDHQGGGIRHLRHHQMKGRRAPIHRRDEHLHQIAKADHSHERADHQLHGAEALPLEQKDGVGDNRRDNHAPDERQAKQKRQADGPAEEFREVGGHGRHLAHHPHHIDQGLRQIVPAELRQIAPGHDAELSGQRLEEHGDEVRHQHHPQQRIAVARAGLDVGGEIAGVHIGDGGDHRRAGEQKHRGRPAPAPGEGVANGRGGAIRQGGRVGGNVGHETIRAAMPSI